jgi:hypothetical protein
MAGLRAEDMAGTSASVVAVDVLAMLSGAVALAEDQ